MVLHKSPHIHIFIMKLTRPAWDWWSRIKYDGTKTSLTGFIYFSNHDTSNIPNLSNRTLNPSLVSQTKCDEMFSDLELDHIFSNSLGTYLVYILFLLVCGNYLLTSKRGRWRNLLLIDSRLNWIDLSTNIISPPNSERGYRTKFGILLGGVFQYSIK